MVSGNRQRDLIADVADALTADRDVQWDRCARRALPADPDKIQNLRDHQPCLQEPADCRAGHRDRVGDHPRSARRHIRALGGQRADCHRCGPGDGGADRARLVMGGLLQRARRRFRPLRNHAGRTCRKRMPAAVRRRSRAADAGPGLVLPAQGHDSVASHPPRLPWDVPLQQLVPDYLLEGSRLSGCLLVPAHVFAPAFLWVFAAEWPRVPRRNRLDDLARRMVPVSVAIGCAIWITCVVAVELARAGYGETRLGLVLDVSLAILSLLMFGAAVVVPLSARSAPAGEAKRTVLFSVGFVVFPGSVGRVQYRRGVLLRELVVQFPVVADPPGDGGDRFRG